MADRRDQGEGRRLLDDADLAGAGRVHDAAHPARRRAARRRGRHVHRLLGAVHRPRARRRRPAARAATSARSGPRSRAQAWERAGVADRIELRIAPAIETLRALPDDEPIDLAFIDADKPSYADYYEELLAAAAAERADPRRQHRCGAARVVDESATDDNTVAIRAFNDMVAADDRVETAMLPIGDGVTLLRKS